MLLLIAGCASRVPLPANDASAAELFEQADRLFLDALLAVEARNLEELLDAENRLPEERRDALLALTERGVAQAELAIRREPEDARHPLLLAAHLMLGSLAQGSARNLIEGRAGRIRRAYERSLGQKTTAAALRLKGKFLMSAPWPFRDRRAADRVLRESLAMAPDGRTHLFLGDLLHGEGDRAAALRQWALAAKTPAGPSQVAELARRRLSVASLP